MARRFALIVPTVAALVLTACGGADKASGDGTANGGSGAEEAPALDVDQIEIIVNQAPGGGADLGARLLQPGLEEQGFDILVENIVEAGGIQGAMEVYNGEPDGSIVGALLLPRTIQQDLLLDAAYDTENFTPILGYCRGRFALIVNPDAPWDDFADLVEASESEPINVAVTGAGSATDLQAARLADVAGADFVRVPFDGAAPARTAVLGGNIDAAIVPFGDDLDGQFRILVVPSEERIPGQPDVPVMSDFDLPEAEVAFFQAIFGPPGMDDSVRDALAAAVEEAVQQPDAQERLPEAGCELDILDSDALSDLITEQKAIVEQYRDLMEQSR